MSTWPDQTQPGRVVLEITLGSHSTMPSCEPWGPRGEEKLGGNVLMILYNSGALIFACKSREKRSQDNESKIMHRNIADSKLSIERCVAWLKKERNAKLETGLRPHYTFVKLAFILTWNFQPRASLPPTQRQVAIKSEPHSFCPIWNWASAQFCFLAYSRRSSPLIHILYS